MLACLAGAQKELTTLRENEKAAMLIAVEAEQQVRVVGVSFALLVCCCVALANTSCINKEI